MTGGPAGAPPASAPRDADAGAELCVLLACFAGRKRAAKIRRQLDKQLGRERRRDPGPGRRHGQRQAQGASP